MIGSEYHKIQSIWKRTQRGLFIPWQWSTPEIGLLANVPWTWTEKVDGTNTRLGLDGGRLVIGGRTDNAQIPTHLANAIHGLEGLPERIAEHCPEAVLYGEGYGAKIQKGGNYRPDQGFVLFDVKIGGLWLKRADVLDIGEKLGLSVVPDVMVGTIRDAIDVVAPQTFNSSWGDFLAEGLVGKPAVDLFDRRGRRIVCKVKACDFARLAREGVMWGGK